MLRFCLECTTAYAVDLQFCPNCGSVKWGYTSPLRSGSTETLAPALPATKAAPARKAKTS